MTALLSTPADNLRYSPFNMAVRKTREKNYRVQSYYSGEKDIDESIMKKATEKAYDGSGTTFMRATIIGNVIDDRPSVQRWPDDAKTGRV